MRTTPFVFAFAFAAWLPAQSSFTLPSDFEQKPGDSAVTQAQPWGVGSGRFQYSDHGQSGPLRAGIRAVELRRDESARTTSSARASDVTLRIGYALPEASLTNLAQLNFQGAPTVVLAAQVSLPATTPGQQPWGQIVFPFQQPFDYDPALGGLIVDFECHNTTPSGVYSLDCTDGTLPGEGSFSHLDPNDRCFTQNGSMDLVQLAPRTDVSGIVTVASYCRRAPSNAPSVLIWGLPSAAPTPLLCATLRVAPEIASFPLRADQSGSIGTQAMPNVVSFAFPGQAVTVAAQYASLDPTRVPIPAALSDAARFTVVAPTARNAVSRLSGEPSSFGFRSPLYVPVIRLVQ
jgi:hypothetical protein